MGRRMPGVVAGAALGLLLTAGPFKEGTRAAPASADDWRRDAVCAPPLLTDPGRPRETARPPCDRAFCVELGAQERVCACRTSDASGDAITDMVFDRPHEKAISWNVALNEMAGPDAFRVLRSDLTGDGRPDTVVAALVSRSSGMGVERWSVTVLDGRSPEPAAAEEVEDFGVLSVFTAPSTGGPCLLLAGRWKPGHDPARGPGLYFVGRWLRVRTSGPGAVGLNSVSLEAIPERPLIRRRLLYGFERARLAAMDANPVRPLNWYAAPGVEIVEHLCQAGEDVAFSFRTLSGLLVSVCRARSDEYLVYRSRTTGGQLEQFPPRLDRSWDQFALSSYARGGGLRNAGLDLTALSFSDTKQDVEVFQDWSAESDREIAGLKITDHASRREITLDADASTQIGRLGDLRRVTQLKRTAGRN